MVASNWTRIASPTGSEGCVGMRHGVFWQACRDQILSGGCNDMAKLIYITNVSLDGFIEDARGRFDWVAPDEELFAFITDLVRPVGTWLYGRRLYETMAVWETDPALGAQSELMGDFANVW